MLPNVHQKTCYSCCMKRHALAIVLALTSCAPRSVSPSDEIDRLAKVVAEARMAAPLARAGCALLGDAARRATCEHDLDVVNDVLKQADGVVDNARVCREKQDEVCLARTRQSAAELLEKIRSFGALRMGDPSAIGSATASSAPAGSSSAPSAPASSSSAPPAPSATVAGPSASTGVRP